MSVLSQVADLSEVPNNAQPNLSSPTALEKELPKSTTEGYKIILLGDSAVGKSKLVERFLMGDFEPYQLSTYALTLFNYETKVNGKPVKIVFWDTAGQERFQSMHPSYYHRACCCLLVFDVTRKKTYKHLTKWYTELRENCPNIPCICVANKIDIDHRVTSKAFKFPKQHNIPLMYVSAADGTNVAKLFNEGIRLAVENDSKDTDDFMDQIMELIAEPNFGKELPPLTPSLAEQALVGDGGSSETTIVNEGGSGESVSATAESEAATTEA